MKPKCENCGSQKTREQKVITDKKMPRIGQKKVYICAECGTKTKVSY